MKNLEASPVRFQLLEDGRARWLRPGSPVREGTLAELAACGATHWCWLVDGRTVQIARLTVPAANERVQQQALPYALEEQLLSPVEDLLFASRRLGATEYVVAMTARVPLEAAWSVLQQHGIQVDQVLADTFAVPLPSQGWTLASGEGRAWLRCGNLEGYAFEPEAWADFLRQQLAAGESPQSLLLASDRLSAAEVEQVAPGLSVEIERWPGHALEFLGASSSSPDVPDFISVLPRARDAQQQARRQGWLAAVALLLLGLTAHFAWLGWTVRQLEVARAKAEVAAEETLRSRFPAIQRVVDVRAQAAQALAAESGGRQANRLLELLAPVAPVLAESSAEGVALQSLEFEGERLELRVAGTRLEHLQSLQTALQAAAPSLQTVSMETAEGRTQAVWRIGGAP